MTAAGGGAAAGPPPVPAEVERDLPDRAALLHRYAGWLADAGVVRGLVGPRERDRLWDRHLLNSLALVPLLPDAARVVDVGSGAGLPGIAVALARPDLDVTLLEPLARRVRFLEEVVADLDVPVRVVRGRAEEVPAAASEADVVVARAVAPLGRLVAWCVPLLRPGGVLLALKGGTAADEVAGAGPALDAAGAKRARVVTSTGPGGGTATVVEVVRASGGRTTSPGGRPTRTSRAPGADGGTRRGRGGDR